MDWGGSALVVGPNGQDGKLICQFFESQKKPFLKVDRCGIWFHEKRIAQMNGLTPKDLSLVFRNFKTSEVYFLAAHSRSTQDQLHVPQSTEYANHLEVERLLKLIIDAIAYQENCIIVLFANSMRIFEGYKYLKVDETTQPFPESLYAEHKIRCSNILDNEESRIGNFKSINAILFNHESVYRQRNYMSAKVIQAALEWNHRAEKSEKVRLMFPNSKRDFGYAPQFVETFAFLVRQRANGSFIFCSGEQLSVRDFADAVCAEIGAPFSQVFSMDDSTQDAESSLLIHGDNSKLLRQIDGKRGFFLSGTNLISQLIKDWREVLRIE